jgi:hypothetical protein
MNLLSMPRGIAFGPCLFLRRGPFNGVSSAWGDAALMPGARSRSSVAIEKAAELAEAGDDGSLRPALPVSSGPEDRP